MKASYLIAGLIIGTLWGFLSTAVFITVAMFNEEGHPYHWLFEVFYNSFDAVWFQTLFFPFLLSSSAGPIFAIFGSIPVGAVIGIAIGAVASVLSYTWTSRKMSRH